MQPVTYHSMICAAAWNVRGLNGIAHQKSVQQLVGEFKVQFLGLLETRVRAPNSLFIQKSTLPSWRWFVDYNDPGSRIWLAWCEEEIEVKILAVDKQFIHCDVTNKKEHTKCLITVLYGDNELTGRRELWQGILQLSRNITDEPWIVMCDFNAVIDDSEVSGYAADTRVSMADFLECITEAELTHLPFAGAHFTWHNCSDGGRSLWKRLDRMLVNEAWQLFGGTRRQSQLNMDHLQPFAKHLISEDEAEQLISPIQRQEIKDALFDINEDSAPGPDGFSSCFFKATWTIIGEDVCQAVMEFFNHGRLLKQLNATLITLIPKVQMPMKVGDFRPISCCNVVYKIITKIMVKRMRLVLEKLIDSCQNAFVPGRSISDNILLAQELLSGYNQKKLPPRCTVKVDLQKAYDMVDWDYLLAVLRLFKFPNRFIMWIEQCITTASFSISLNGSIHGFFSSSRGLRQGDLISPYLFVLVMESLHLIIKSKVTTDTTFQYHWRCKELGIVNLCFADDLLLFCKADPQSVTVLHRILQEFKDLAGLQANAQKSQVLLSKTTDPMKQQILNILGFPQGTFPVRYLGVPLITSKLSLEDCTPLLLKIDARISGWNQLQLTYAGRTQLIKSILSSIHQHWCSVFILPKGVLKAIEAKLRNFLWRGGTATGGYKVAWEQVCKPISHGGLGIRNIQTMMNNALMSKHLWQILIQKHDSIWVSWITKHRLKHGTVWAVKETEGSWIWKKLLKLRARLLHGIQYHVGDGAEFKLWLDPWHPDGALLNKHPHGPFITGLPMDSNLSTVIDGDEWKWPSAYHMDINDIMSRLPAIHHGQPDVIVWKNSSGRYTSKDAYELFSPISTPVEWAPLLHGRFHTPRHTFILWLATLERLSTLDKPWCNPTNQVVFYAMVLKWNRILISSFNANLPIR
ncbi:UNVERIFIED_CONTAM: hypothetical protein Scaly_2925500 [Sesamum calycinum]|uniref:Reverse transcriptase domain-containing protein n=1 Tax=Sesamum calycinum TaxID=2727403 RepID=A0AAW2KVD9_9LAMI